jgi:hypothetical protein
MTVGKTTLGKKTLLHFRWNGARWNNVRQNDVRQNDITQNDVRQNDVRQNDVRQNDIRRNDVVPIFRRRNYATDICVGYETGYLSVGKKLLGTVFLIPVENSYRQLQVMKSTVGSYENLT